MSKQTEQFLVYDEKGAVARVANQRPKEGVSLIIKLPMRVLLERQAVQIAELEERIASLEKSRSNG